MGGVITGSEILGRENRKGNTLGITINNNCNLLCPHCYIVGDRNSKVISEEMMQLYGKAEFESVVIVGQEPFFDERSKKASLNIMSLSKKYGSKYLGLMTNATMLDSDFAYKVKKAGAQYVDVSMDGGAETYETRRGLPFEMVLDGIKAAKNAGLKVNILHTLYRENTNVHDIKDMFSIREYISDGLLLFSPYIPIDGTRVGEVGLETIIDTLKDSGIAGLENTYLMLDELNARQFGGIEGSELKRMISDKGLEDRIYRASVASTEKVLRVTHDGIALHPFDSVDVVRYKDNGIVLDSSSDLEKVRKELVMRKHNGVFNKL